MDDSLAQPTLLTERLILRPLSIEDAPDIQRLAGMPEVSASTLRISYPYPPGAALDFIFEQEALFSSGGGCAFGIEIASNGLFCGCIGLGREREHFRAELGYWIGVPFWGRGFATEAARRVIDFGFTWYDLYKITARHFASNPASGRVLEKVGMRREGHRRGHFYKAGRGYEDSVEYGLLSRDWHQLVKPNGG